MEMEQIKVYVMGWITTPRDVYILIPGTREYVALHSKRTLQMAIMKRSWYVEIILSRGPL